MSHKASVLPSVSNWKPWRALSREGTKLDVKYGGSAPLQQGDRVGGDQVGRGGAGGKQLQELQRRVVVVRTGTVAGGTRKSAIQGKSENSTPDSILSPGLLSSMPWSRTQAPSLLHQHHSSPHPVPHGPGDTGPGTYTWLVLVMHRRMRSLMLLCLSIWKYTVALDFSFR